MTKVIVEQPCLHRSVNYLLTVVSVARQTVGLLQWKMVFKLPNFYLKSKRFQTFFVFSKMAQLSIGLPVLALEGVLGGP